MANETTRLIPVKDWPKYHLWPPIGGLRHLIFNAHTNGFDQVIRRCGGRVLIDEAAFDHWTKSNCAENKVMPASAAGRKNNNKKELE